MENVGKKPYKGETSKMDVVPLSNSLCRTRLLTQACALSLCAPCFSLFGSQRTRRVLSVSPQELLTRAPFPTQPPERFKVTWMSVREEMTKNYPHEFQRLGVVVLTAGQETACAAATSKARASGQLSYASLRKPYNPAYASLRPKPL